MAALLRARELLGSDPLTEESARILRGAGGDQVAWSELVDTHGLTPVGIYDDGINYRAESNLTAAIARVCPSGIDVFFDNTSDPIHDAVLQNLALHARITLCGTVSLADRFGKPDIEPRFLRQILGARTRIQGFLVLDYQPRYQEAWTRLAHWYRTGALKSHYDIVAGLEHMPEAFLRLLTSQNLGKQLARVSEEDGSKRASKPNHRLQADGKQRPLLRRFRGSPRLTRGVR